jgi:phage shock protein C
MTKEIKRLYRSSDERVFSGVCGGIGEFFGIDPTIVRLTFILVTFVWPFTPLLYLILMLVVPEDVQSHAPVGASVDGEVSTDDNSDDDLSPEMEAKE